MLRRLCLTIILTAALALIATPVWATYYVYLTVVNTGGGYGMLALNKTMQVDALVDGGYIAANGTDTRVTDNSLYVLPHMLAEDRLMWASPIGADSTTEFIFWTEQTHLESFPTITGHGGYVRVPDSSDLEPRDVYMFYIVGYFDTSYNGTDRAIIRKDGAVAFNVTGTQELTFTVTGGNSLIASSVASGYHAVYIYCDGTDMWIEVNGVLKDTIAASSIPNTGNDWYLFEDDTMPYVSYYGQWVVVT